MDRKAMICDTGVFSRYAAGVEAIPDTIDHRIGLDNTYITPVICIELYNWLSGYHTLTKPKRAALFAFIKALPLPHLTEDISRLAVALSDKSINSKPGDLLIAATALQHSCPVYTLNKKDFRSLGVALIE